MNNFAVQTAKFGPTWTFASDGNMSAPGHIFPTADLSYDLGSPELQWRSIYVGTGTIYIGGVALGVNQDNYVTVDGNPIITVNTSGNLTIQGNTNVVLGSVVISDTAPDATTPGSQWYNSLDGRTYIAYNGQWVDTSPAVVPSPETYLDEITIDGSILNINGSTLTINNSGTLLVNGSEVVGSGGSGNIYGATLTASATDPGTSTGTLWFNTVEGRTYLKYNDQWVDVNPTVVPPPETYLGSITIDDSTININGGTLTIDNNGTLLVNGSEVTGSGSGYQLTSSTAVMSIDSSGTVTFPSSLQIVDIGPLGGGMFTGTVLLQQGPGILQVVSSGTASVLGWSDNAFTPNVLTTLALSSTGAELTVGNINSGTYVWHFGTDGSTTFPDDTILGTGLDPNVYIETLSTGTTNTWTFTVDGGLTFPDGTTQTTAYTGGGSDGVKYSSVLDAYAGDFTVNTEQLVLVNNNAISTCTITLPASPTNGQTVTIKKTASFTSWTVVVDGNGKNIDSSGTLSFNNSYGYVIVAYSTEHAYNQWFIVGGNYATV